MAGMESALSVLPVIQQGVNIATQLSGGGAGNDNRALEELQARQNAQMQALQENTALQREKIALQAAQSEDARKDALKRAVARKRAQTGASGITQSGSTEAVLLGMFEESEAQRAERESLDNLRLNALDQDIAQQNRLNILQQTQLKQRQGVDKASAGFGLVNSLAGLF